MSARRKRNAYESMLRHYRWEIGSRLVNEVKVRDVEAAERSVGTFLQVLATQTQRNDDLDEMKMFTVQVVQMADRAAYEAGADPVQVLRTNITFVGRVIDAKKKGDLVTLARKAIRKLISLVPEHDYVNEPRINKAVQFVRDHCTEDIHRITVAGAVGCSPSYLSRIFSAAMGRTLKEFMIQERIEKAKEQLRTTRRTITETAFDVGYGDPNYFSAVFKKRTGVSPSQYRKRVTHSLR